MKQPLNNSCLGLQVIGCMDSRQQIMDRDVCSPEFLIEAAPMEQVLPRQFVGTQRWFWCGLIEKDRGWFSDV